MKSIEQVLTQYKGIGPGFDFLRIFLAVSIVLFHSMILTGNDWMRDTPLWFIEYGLVPMFFALSGFLVTASGMRLSLKNFLINRGLRIVPALAVDVIFCSLIVGPIMTTVSYGEYFTDSRFWSYFLNITGYIHYYLPGVFETHESTMVNGALWTVPYEVMCYVIISIFIYFKLLPHWRKTALFAFVMIGGGIFAEYSGVLEMVHWRIRETIQFTLISRESQIVTTFVFGVLFYQLRGKIPYSYKLFTGCIGICLLAAFLLDTTQTTKVAWRIILLPVLTYMTVFIGLTPVPVPKFFKSGDYSYGIYLYHDPLLQVVIGVFPAISAISGYGGLFIFAIGLPLVILMAFLSWNVIEKPILALRKKFSFVAKMRGVEGAAH